MQTKRMDSLGEDSSASEHSLGADSERMDSLGADSAREHSLGADSSDFSVLGKYCNKSYTPYLFNHLTTPKKF